MLDSETTDAVADRTGELIKGITEIGTNALLFLLIFGMSGTVDIRNLKKQLRNRYAILTGVAMQFLVMPFLGFLAVISLKGRITPSMGITLLIVTASPGGSYSNWWCSLFNADLALSVAMTALSTVLSIGLLPLNLVIYAHAAYGFNTEEENNVLKSVDFVALMVSLVIVISAILTGLYASYKSDSVRFRKSSNAVGSMAGLFLIGVSAVFSTNGSGEGGKPWEQDWSFYVGVSLPCIGGLILSNLIAKCAKLEKPEIVTLSVECCYQNIGIAASAALAMFDDPEDVSRAMSIPLFYGLVEAGVLGLYCLVAWKFGWTKAPSDEKICVVLTKTYEVDEDEISEESVDEENKVSSSNNVDDSSRIISIAPTMSSSSTKLSDASRSPIHSPISTTSQPVMDEFRITRQAPFRPRAQSDTSISYDETSDSLGMKSLGDLSLNSFENMVHSCGPLRTSHRKATNATRENSGDNSLMELSDHNRDFLQNHGNKIESCQKISETKKIHSSISALSNSPKFDLSKAHEGVQRSHTYFW